MSTILVDSHVPASTQVAATPRVYRGYGPYLQLVGVLLLLAGFHQTQLGDLVSAQLIDLWLWYTAIVLGFWLIFGATGQFAFCQAAFVGLGAYTGNLWWGQGNAWVGFLIAAAFSAVIATAFALLVRKASHLYFAIVTLGLGMIAGIIWQQNEALTHGVNGIVMGVSPITIFGRTLTSDEDVFWLLFGFVAILFVGRIWIARSPALREMIAFRDSPVVAAMLGVPNLRVRIVSFVAGSVIAGVAGAFYAHWNGFSSPDAYSLDLAIAVFIMLVLGGTNSLWGPLLGAAFFTYLPHVLPVAAGWQYAIYGALLVLVVITMPRGLAELTSQLRTALERWRRRRPPKAKRGSKPVVDEHEQDFALAARLSPPVAKNARVVLRCTGVQVSFGGVRAVDNVSFDLREGEILGLVGPNGSGKSSLLNALGGIVPARGQLQVGGESVRLGSPGRIRGAGVLRTFQTPQPLAELTCIENVLLTSPDRRWTGLAGALLARPLMFRRERARWQRAGAALSAVGLLPFADGRAGDLSYGLQRMLELARAMAGDPKVLMLDEPSAGLTAAETVQLSGYLDQLRAKGVSMVLVDHKIDLIASLCDRVIVLDIGRVIAEGTPEGVFANQRVVEAYLGVAD